MSGMDRHTGRSLSGWPHIRQSLIDLLSTRVGTRVHRREYGSAAVELIDRPSSAETVLDRFVAIATALDRWEPRVTLRGFRLVAADADGHAVIEIEVADAAGTAQMMQVAA